VLGDDGFRLRVRGAAGSPLWQVFTEFAKLGAGLASSLGVSMFPRWMAAAFGNQLCSS
jgi:hypothetical protein